VYRRIGILFAGTVLAVLPGVVLAHAQSQLPEAVASPVPDRTSPDAVVEQAPGLALTAEAALEGETDPDLTLEELQVAESRLIEYDPWIPFNERVFAFNHGFDRHLLKPVATAYDKVIPNFIQRGVRNVFDNIGSIRRIVNTALQGRFDASGQELGRFVINSVFGLGGLIDAAPSFGVAPRTEADTGQTLGVWGAGPGPYLVLPLLPPLTVRDALGTAVDVALDPLAWVAPFEALLAIRVERTVNDRSLNLELYEDVEESVVDLYSAVRNAYLQQRARAVREAAVDSPFGRRHELILTGPEEELDRE
jgi:phospholipid-binding lipoprotein MlaA